MHEAIYKKLKEVARTKKLITYGDLNKELKLGFDFDKPEDRGKIGEWLGEISEYEVQQGRPMLSAVVVHKQDEGYGDPGDGFFKLARDLNRFRGGVKYVFWVSELNTVHNYWSSH